MPSIMLKNIAAGTADALQGLRFQNQDRAAFVSIYATTAVAGGTISFSVGSREHLVAAQVNIEASADVIDTDRDCVLFREAVARGQYSLSVAAQICNALIVIEYS